MPMKMNPENAGHTGVRNLNRSPIDGCRFARAEGAVIVSVDVAELAPGVTDAGFRPQVGNGAGPITAHVSRIAVANGPFCGARVITSVICAPGCNVRLVDAGEREKFGDSVKVAVTDSAALMVTVHAPVPEQTPLQAVRAEPEAGVAVKSTVIPRGKLAEQVPGQFMPAGLLVTVPAPLPATVTERTKSGGTVRVTVALADLVGSALLSAIRKIGLTGGFNGAA